MVNVVFKNVSEVPTYEFDVAVFFITLGAFIMCYVGAMLFYVRKISNVSIKHAMSEE